MEESEEEISHEGRCSHCNKKYSNIYNLQKHFGTCNAYLATNSKNELRNQPPETVYNVDKSLDKYVDTCDNEYEKFM